MIPGRTRITEEQILFCHNFMQSNEYSVLFSSSLPHIYFGVSTVSYPCKTLFYSTHYNIKKLNMSGQAIVNWSHFSSYRCFDLNFVTIVLPMMVSSCLLWIFNLICLKGKNIDWGIQRTDCRGGCYELKCRKLQKTGKNCTMRRYIIFRSLCNVLLRRKIKEYETGTAYSTHYRR
jgi:hypothetical protein